MFHSLPGRLAARSQGVIQDFRYAARTFAKSPGLTAAIVVSIALGIAANTTVFSVVNGLLFGALPVQEPDRLVSFSDGRSLPYLDYLDYRAQTKDVFQDVCASFPMVPASLGGMSEPERIWGQAVSGNYFSTAGVQPALGRGFLPEEDEAPGRNPVVVLSYALWQRRFAGDARIIGRKVILNNRSYTVVGVAPRGFHGVLRGIDPAFWVPLAMFEQIMPDLGKAHLTTKREANWLTISARLKPGVSVTQATTAVNVIQKRIDSAYRKEKTPRNPIRLSAAGGLPGGMGRFAISLSAVLMVVVGLVLLIACANVANLLLARAAARQKEIGIRLALGASRTRLVRQLLTESLLLSAAGAGVGLLLAIAATSSIAQFKLPLQLPVAFQFTPDHRVLLFTAVLAVLTGVLFGFAPAWRATRPNLVTALKEQSASFGSRRRFGLRNLLVLLQVSLSLILLVGAGLFLRSLRNASSIDTGMRPDHVLLMAVDPKPQNYSPAKTKQFLTQLRERVTALPGVVSTTFLDTVPLSLGGVSYTFRVENSRTGTKEANADVYRVGGHFFETMGIPLRRGREFQPRTDSGREVILNETMAQRLFGNEDPLGKQVRAEHKTYEVIGIARNHKSRTLGEEPTSCAYLSLEQDPTEVMSFFGISIVVKTAGDPQRYMHAVRSQIHDLDPNLAVFNAETMREHINKSLLIPRICASLLGIFGAIGLVLAAVGLYGVMNFSVRSRTREIGIRMALGASARSVVQMVTTQGALLTGIGLAIGMAAAFGLSRYAASLLYGVSATDRFTFVAVPLVLLLVAIVAVWLPARRAARIDPMTALREE